jgi:hypothetical protein
LLGELAYCKPCVGLFSELLETLEKQQLVQTVARLRTVVDLL